MTDRPALLLDLDGTLTDSVYQHALAWHKALELSGIKLSVWRIHRRIGMSGGLLAESLARETGRELSEKEAAKMKTAHARLFAAQLRDVRPLPGAKELIRHLTRVRWRMSSFAPGSGRTSRNCAAKRRACAVFIFAASFSLSSRPVSRARLSANRPPLMPIRR